MGPAATYPGYSLVPVSFCFPCTCLLEELHCIPCAVSQRAARAVWSPGDIMDSFHTIKLGFEGWILCILLVRAVNQRDVKELLGSFLVETICPEEELGAGVGFLKQSALNFPQMSYGLLSVGQLEWARQKGVGPLPKFWHMLDICGDAPSAMCVLLCLPRWEAALLF